MGEEESEQAFEKSKAASQRIVDTTTAAKLAAEDDLAEVEAEKSNEDRALKKSKDDQRVEEKLKGSLNEDCKWIKSHFESRKKKRAAEMDGLTEAKGFLAGMQDEDAAL